MTIYQIRYFLNLIKRMQNYYTELEDQGVNIDFIACTIDEAVDLLLALILKRNISKVEYGKLFDKIIGYSLGVISLKELEKALAKEMKFSFSRFLGRSLYLNRFLYRKLLTPFIKF